MTVRDDATASADVGTSVVFADAVVPGLAAGEYEVEVTQAIAGDIGKPGRHEFRHAQPIRVTGPHFGLGPDDVFSVHPPAGSDADWSGYLPSVVLSQRGLPWVIEIRADERIPGGEAPVNAPVPWCAVLLSTPEEIAAGDPQAAVSPTGARQILLTDYLNPPAGVRGPAFTQQRIARFLQEHPADFTVTTIDVPAAVFSRIAPSLQDARLLAHTRTVRDDVRALVDAQAAGDYAVVIGNRLAAGSDSGVYIAHLVSLEGFEDALPPAHTGGADRVRLLSLTGWTFTSRDIGPGFADVMRNLEAGPLKMPDALGGATGPDVRADACADADPSDPADPQDPAELIRKALALGYTAADYRTRLGERTVAWYRGPLLPVVMKPNPQPPFEDAEAALVYDPDTGMFDVSFAAAWQAGRLLALADRDIATALAAWVRRSRSALIRALGRDRLARTHSLLAATATATTPAGAATGKPAGKAAAAARARALMAAQLAPRAVADAAGSGISRARSGSGPTSGVWGPPLDLSGLLEQVDRLPGLVAPDELEDMLSGAGTPTAALLAAVRTRAAAGEAVRSVESPSPQESSFEPAARSRADVGGFPGELRALVADRKAAAAALSGEPLPSEVLAWLDRLGRLHAIPFRLLVPDTRALPPESIRFAHLDANWIGALVDGALSVAAVDEPDHAVLDLLRPTVHQALRSRSSGSSGPSGPSGPSGSSGSSGSTGENASALLSGFLLRSTAVADFPGLRVQGYADRAGLRPLTPRRLERLSPTTLIALFEGQVGRVDLATPAQGSGCGVLFSAQHPTGEVYLRGLGGAFPSGRQIPGPALPVPFRQNPDPAIRILDAAGLHAAALRTLSARYAPEPVPPLGPGAFGLQLVVGGETQAFENLAAPAAEPSGPAAEPSGPATESSSPAAERERR